MYSLKSWQQNAVKDKRYFRWLIPAIAAIIVPGYVLTSSAISNAAQTAKIVLVNGSRVSVKWSNGSRKPAAKGIELRSNNDALVVDGDNYSYANLKIGSSDPATAGKDSEPSEYTFPCTYGGKWTIGMKSGCVKGILFKSLKSNRSQSPRTKQITYKKGYIYISRASNDPTVIQTDEKEGGSKLTVDVLAGTVTIRSFQNPAGVNVSKGQRYTYFVDEQINEPYIKDYAPNEPDWDAVQIFLNPNNWEPSDATQIEEYTRVVDQADEDSSPTNQADEDNSPTDQADEDNSPTNQPPIYPSSSPTYQPPR